MSSFPFSAFDSVAAGYDDQWTHTPVGKYQRKAVWRIVDPLIAPSHQILDLGCGTGEDALHFANLGASVLALDSSSAMVSRARAKGVEADVMAIEHISGLRGTYDLVFSNFGALNCVGDLPSLREPLERLVRRDGYLAICLMGRFCIWELGYYLRRGLWKKASRRWLGQSSAAMGLRVYYPRVRQIRRALGPSFELRSDTGVGICVPPSFTQSLNDRLLHRLDRIDRKIAHLRVVRAVADHRLLLFRRA